MGLLSPICSERGPSGGDVSIVTLAFGGSSPYCFRSSDFPRRLSTFANSRVLRRPSTASLSASALSGSVSFHASPCFSSRSAPLSFARRIALRFARSNGIALSLAASRVSSPALPRIS